MTPGALAEKREIRKLRKALVDLTDTVGHGLALLDAAMQGPSTPERGSRVAKIANVMDMQNDSAMHFALGMNFEQIKKSKERWK